MSAKDMESREVFTQEELDAVLESGSIIPVCAGDGAFVVSGIVHVRAGDTVRVTARDQAVVHAGGEAVVRASGSATVLASGRVIVEAADEVSVRAAQASYVQARGSASVILYAQAVGSGSGHAQILARGRSTLTAGDFSRVRAHERARVVARGEATVLAWDSAGVEAYDRVGVNAWGSASVRAYGESTVEARESCSVDAGGRAHVRAFGASMVRARGGTTIDARGPVSVIAHGTKTTVNGGNVIRVPSPQTALEWCDHYGVEVKDGIATLYKAVDADFNSYHGMSYAPGTQPQAPDWDGGGQECGGGIHLSPRPGLALPRTYGARRFVACPVRVADIVTHPGGYYPDTVKAPGICAPVYEVDELGRPINASAPADRP